MTYVAPEEAAATNAVGPLDLSQIRREMGAAPWRRPLVATETTRWVLWGMPAGYTQPAHQHPRADEVFQVLDGRATFRFTDGRGEISVSAGQLLFAPRGVAHEITVPGPEPLILLVSVTPNEDAPDETIDE